MSVDPLCKGRRDGTSSVDDMCDKYINCTNEKLVGSITPCSQGYFNEATSQCQMEYPGLQCQRKYTLIFPKSVILFILFSSCTQFQNKVFSSL